MPEKQDQVTDAMRQEIEIIQDIVTRMANNSFLIKGWAITLIVGTLLIESKFTDNLVQTNQPLTMLIAFLPLIVFWYLDAWFLWQERLYRKLYDWVITNRPTSDEHLYSMNAYRFREQVDRPFRIMFSTTLGLFYGMVGVLTAFYILLRIWFPTLPAT